ncbi:MAG: hypothetical protein H3C47_12915 [Candidatus Cloacimonetes bacterium]|nr:hypothetical protein [Candidatus Cloacimonadota bacterium]
MSEDTSLWEELKRLDDEYWERFIHEPDKKRAEAEIEWERQWKEHQEKNPEVPFDKPWPNIEVQNAPTFKFGLMMFDHEREQEAIDLLKSILAGERGPLTEAEVMGFAWTDEKLEKLEQELREDGIDPSNVLI